MSFQILTINPGSTSTKIAIFEDEKEIFSKTLRHTAEELSPYATVASQFQFRKNIILSELQQAGWDIHGFHAIVGRGGLVKPIESGIYEVNDALAHDLEYPVMGEHASNLGGLIARDIVREMLTELKPISQTRLLWMNWIRSPAFRSPCPFQGIYFPCFESESHCTNLCTGSREKIRRNEPDRRPYGRWSLGRCTLLRTCRRCQ